MTAAFNSWNSWWFPGLSEFLDMVSQAFWWSLAVVVGVIPAAIVIGGFVLFVLVTRD